MHSRALLCALVAIGLAACSATADQQASTERCRDFALSGGYPYLQGGPTYGPNSSVEQLPGAPPLVLAGPASGDITGHLDEEQYLQTWCEHHPSAPLG